MTVTRTQRFYFLLLLYVVHRSQPIHIYIRIRLRKFLFMFKHMWSTMMNGNNGPWGIFYPIGGKFGLLEGDKIRFVVICDCVERCICFLSLKFIYLNNELNDDYISPTIKLSILFRSLWRGTTPGWWYFL